MDIDQLREFCTVVRFQNITKAAAYMYLSQPTLSRHLSELEQSLGAELIERGNSRAFALTPAGEMLHQEGEKLLSQLEETELHVKRAGTGLTGRLRVCSGLICSEQTNRLLHDFAREHGGIDMQFFCLEIGPTFNQIMNDYADVGLSYSYEAELHRDEVDTQLLSRERFYALVSDMNPLSRKKSVTIDELRRETMVYVREPEEGIMDREPLQSVMSLFKANSIPVGSRSTMVLQTRIDRGFSVFPYSAIMAYTAGCQALEISDLPDTVELILMWRRDNKNPCLGRFLRFVQDGI